MSGAPRHAFTVDLEEWFCSHNLRSAAPYESWDSLESRIERNTDYLLGRLDAHSVRATFFVLGWVAERNPGLVSAIAAEGHEIATHGYAHRPLGSLSAAELDADLRRSLGVLRDLAPRPVVGYRAPAFSITDDTWWALDVLKRCGLRYDSSVYPFSLHPEYGVAGAPLAPHRHGNGLIEAPLSCAEYRACRLPCAGGAYFRLLPYRAYRRLFERCTGAGRALVFYIHPWEWDSDMPRLAARAPARFRHYANTGTVKRKLDALLQDVPFATLSDVLSDSGLAPS